MKYLQTDGANQNGPRIYCQGNDVNFEKSDGISFAGVKALNPQTNKPTRNPLIVSIVAFDAGARILTISPNLRTDGPYKNASKLPANGAIVTNHSRGQVR